MKKIYIITFLMAFLVILLCSYSANAQIVTKKALTLEAAKKIAATAEAEALKNKWTMVVAIVDDGGNLVYLVRMDNTQIGSIDVAIEKAKTAISFKRSTKTFEERVLGGRTVILGIPGIMPIEGGLPIIVDGQYIGAIGVSGGASDQDGIAAKAAIDAFSEK